MRTRLRAGEGSFELGAPRRPGQAAQHALPHQRSPPPRNRRYHRSTMLQVGGAAILATPAEGLEGPLLPALVQALIRLLGSELLERAAVNVGGVILELLRADEAQIVRGARLGAVHL